MDPISYSRLEHVKVDTIYGPAVMHCRRKKMEAAISGSSRDVDWWRTPAPRKGLLRRLLDAVIGKR